MRNRPIPNVPLADAAFVRSLLIHEDEALLAFDKPSGLPVQTRGGRGRALDRLLWAFARSNGKRPKLVHRLDTGTSGVVLAAKTKPAAAAVSEAFAKRRVKKTYLAIASGAAPDTRHGMIDVALKLYEPDRGRGTMRPSTAVGAQTAETRWRTLASDGRATLFEVRPRTGRLHQIRAHLASIGYPILGDDLYGGDAAPRLMLHAFSLELTHPSGAPFAVSAAPPAAFLAAAPLPK